MNNSATTFLTVSQQLTKTNPDHIAVYHYGKILWLQTSEITHLRGEGNYTYITMRSGTRYLICKTLKIVQETAQRNFLRVHKSFVINPEHIMIRLEADVLLMKCGTKVPIARRRIREMDTLLN